VKVLYFLFFYTIFFAVTGCKISNTASSEPPPADSTSTINFQVSQLGMRNLRIGEYYFMWIKVANDTVWKQAKQLSISYISSSDTAVIVGTLKNVKVDSISGVLITIERTSNPLTPGLPLLQAYDFNFDLINKVTTAILDHSSILGDYSSLQGSLVFTSKSSDSLAYTHEFYLMNVLGSIQSASLTSLTTPSAGWKYGLWVEDTNFTPHEYFFYGLFFKATGHDSDSTNDFYPFPGGWKIQQMNMPSGSIIVTLEPQFYGDSLKYVGPSPFTLLSFNRTRFIEKNKNYPMTNLSAFGVPSGTITFRRN